MLQSLMAVATIFLLFHVQATGREMQAFAAYMLQKFGSHPQMNGSERELQQELRVEEALWEIRVKSYTLISRVLVHVAAAGLLGLLMELGQKPGLSASARVVICCVAYVQHMVAGYKLVQMTPGRVNAICWMLHIMLVLFMLASALAGENDFAVMQGFQVSVRFGIIFCFINSHVSVPFQFLFSLIELWTWLFVRGQMDATVVFAQCFTLAMSLAACVFVEMWVRSRIQAMLESADAESMISGFRRMLRGVCDGEVLLDGRLRIHGDVVCLKHLLMTNINFEGREFAQLLREDERNGFAKFIQASVSEEAAAKVSGSAPSCLRVSFVGSHGIRVGADIFHVAVPHLFGGDEPYHLLAVKEDWESRPQPEARVEDVPTTLHFANAVASHRSASRRSLRSESSASASSAASSMLLAFPELTEATLLFDVGTPLLDITQTHFKFKRQNEEPDLNADIHSSMPSLRRLIRPTDWETFRGKVERYMQKLSQGGPRFSKALPRLALRMPQDPQKYLVARNVEIVPLSEKSVSAAGSHAPAKPREKFWLHLKDFSPDETRRARHQSALQEIDEFRQEIVHDHLVADGASSCA